MNNEQRIEEIRKRLTAALAPRELVITDESHKHVGHEGAKSGMGHFHVRIVAPGFTGLNQVQKHRLVYETVGDLMQTDIHALGIEAYSPDQV